MSKKLLFDESNNVVKEWFYNRPTNPELNVPIMKMARELAGEMCHRFNLQVLGVNHAKYNYDDIKLSVPIQNTKIALEHVRKESVKGRGIIAFILSRDGVAVGWASARYSQRYECYQYVYTNVQFGKGKNNFVQSKKLSTVVNRASKQFDSTLDGDLDTGYRNSIYDEHLSKSHLDNMLRSIANPDRYKRDKDDVARDISRTEAEALVYHAINKSPIDKTLMERINKVYCRYKELNTKIDETKSVYNSMCDKPIYVLSYTKSIPNIYNLRKLKLDNAKFCNTIIQDFEVIRDDIDNSKYGKLLKPRLAMWNSCKTELFSKDNPHELIGSKYHVGYDRGWSSDVAHYDDGLGIVCYSESDNYIDLKTHSHIMILDAD